MRILTRNNFDAFVEAMRQHLVDFGSDDLAAIHLCKLHQSYPTQDQDDFYVGAVEAGETLWRDWMHLIDGGLSPPLALKIVLQPAEGLDSENTSC